jgi:uncharacterized protein
MSKTDSTIRLTLRRATFWGLALGLVSLFAGCATHGDRLASIQDSYYGGRLDKARSVVEKAIAKNKADADVLKLERSLIDLADGRPQDAERTLREVRDRFDYLEQKDVGESIISTLTDDNRLSYSGEDYEKLLIRCFLSLANLMHDGEDAGAYGLQVGEKQRDIIQAGADDSGTNPKLAYKRVALGAYIHAALQEATHTNWDEAQRSIQLVANWEPEFEFADADLVRVKNGRHSEPGNGVLYVFTLVGRGPYKVERSEVPTSTALLIADRILSATGKHTLPPTISAIKVPVLVKSRNRASNIGVAIDGVHRGDTATITDISQLAIDQYQAVFPRIMARAVVRRVVKKGTIYATKEVAQIDHPVANLALDLAGVAWEASESADTRCWGLLPDQIQVLRLELPAGEHEITLNAQAGGRAIGGGARHTVIVEDGRSTYVLGSFPDDELVGQLLVSNAH